MNDIRQTFARQGLVRPQHERVLGGVAAGLGRRLGLAPWTARILFKRTNEPLLEYACHEGNTGMFGILAGARKLEAEEQAAKR